jgi:hypothetical protein
MNADREQELEVLIRARYPILYIVSWEERRVEESLRQVAARRKKKLYGWTVTKGVVSLDSLKPVGVDPTAKDPVTPFWTRYVPPPTMRWWPANCVTSLPS